MTSIAANQQVPDDAIPAPIAAVSIVGNGPDRRDIALLRRRGGTPGLLWLGGYRSNMRGTKAEFVDAFGAEHGLGVTRFDYSGHGESGGAFEDGTISRWLEEAETVLATTDGPQIVVGSSMGGWIALLLARSLLKRGEGSRLAGLVLIAPAVDMTHDLMLKRMSKAARAELKAGIWYEPSPYGDEPMPITRRLIKDGEQHLFGTGLIETGCPVHVLQGMRDAEVPHAHAASLMERLASDDAILTLVKDGDHRLSRPEDLELLGRTIEGLLDEGQA